MGRCKPDPMGYHYAGRGVVPGENLYYHYTPKDALIKEWLFGVHLGK